MPRERVPARRQCHQRARRLQIDEQHQAAHRERNHQPPVRTGRPQCRHRPPAEDQQGRQHGVAQYAAHQHPRRQAHVASAAHHVGENVEHPHRERTAEHHVGVSQRRIECRAAPAHGLVDHRPGGEHQGREQHRRRNRQHEGMCGERIGAQMITGTGRACNGRRDGTANATGGDVLHEHHKRKHQRYAGQRIGSKTAQEQPVEGNHPCDSEQVEHVGERQPQQRRQDRRFEQPPGACGHRRCGWHRWPHCTRRGGDVD